MPSGRISSFCSGKERVLLLTPHSTQFCFQLLQSRKAFSKGPQNPCVLLCPSQVGALWKHTKTAGGSLRITPQLGQPCQAACLQHGRDLQTWQRLCSTGKGEGESSPHASLWGHSLQRDSFHPYQQPASAPIRLSTQLLLYLKPVNRAKSSRF